MSKDHDLFNDINYFTDRPFVGQDLYRLICGEKIGSGAYRSVYDSLLVKNAVVKITEDVRANILEMEVWKAVKDTPAVRWFAPCLYISPAGHILIQRKARPVKPSDKLPKKLPMLFTDIKKENFGYIGKQLVCTDYQFISRAIDIAWNTNMREVDWNYPN